jgi:hypothetical protein
MTDNEFIVIDVNSDISPYTTLGQESNKSFCVYDNDNVHISV